MEMKWELGEFKEEMVGSKFHQAHEAASSVLSLTLQLREYEKQFEVAKDSLLKQEEELREREEEVAIKLSKIKEKEDEIQKQEKEFQERNSEDKKVIPAQKEVEDWSRMLITKRKELALAQKEHQECIQDLTVKKKQLGSLMKSIEDRSKKLNSEDTKLGFKEKELNRVQKLISETSNDLCLKEKHLCSIKDMIGDYTAKLEDKEKKYLVINSSIDKCYDELARKQKHLDSVKTMIMKKTEELEAKEKQLRSIEGMIADSTEKHVEKEKKYHAINSSIDRCSVELTSKQKHLDSVKKMIIKKIEELEAKDKQCDSINISINKCSAEFSLKQRELELIDKSIEENSSKLQVEEEKRAFIESYTAKLANSIEEREKELQCLNEKMKTDCESLELKLIAVQEAIRKRNEELVLKEKSLKSVQMSVIESNKELEAMKKQKVLLEISISGCSEDLEAKKKQLEVKDRRCEAYAKEIELKNQKIDSLQKLVNELSKKQESKEKQLNDKFPSEATIVQPEKLLPNGNGNSLSVDYQTCSTDNGRYLQLLLNRSFRKHDSVLNEALNAIKNSPDPGKLVVDAMQGFYPTVLKEQDVEFDLSVIRRSCTALLQMLLKISPEFKLEVREEAMKLALEWKSRMKTHWENSLENKQDLQLRQALGFAVGVPVIDLEQVDALQAHEPGDSSTATIDERICPLILDDDMGTPDLMVDEVVRALKSSTNPAKFALDVMYGSYSQHCANGGGELDVRVVKSKLLLLEQLMKFRPIVDVRLKDEAMKLATLWRRNITPETVKEIEVSAFLLFLHLYGLVSCFSFNDILTFLVKVSRHRNAPYIYRVMDFTDMMPHLIQILMQRKQHIEAARFSCAFRLHHIFPVDLILQNCVDHVQRDAKEKATEKELHARKAILQYISEYKLTSRYDTSNMTRCIVELEKHRTNSTPSPSLYVQNGNAPIIDVDNYSSDNQQSLASFVNVRDKRPIG
ncbi:uncharacterized protein [Euphorbia lathyris]|uniref:uncharacterized protein isoform X2 n=1 Tax=Euphorbia lathyris TaxID=212925 RepID=UPI003313C77C